MSGKTRKRPERLTLTSSFWVVVATTGPVAGLPPAFRPGSHHLSSRTITQTRTLVPISRYPCAASHVMIYGTQFPSSARAERRDRGGVHSSQQREGTARCDSGNETKKQRPSSGSRATARP